MCGERTVADHKGPQRPFDNFEKVLGESEAK